MNQENRPPILPAQMPVQNPNNEDEIDLLDLIGVLFKHKWIIIGMTGAAALFILIFSVLSLKLPPEKSFLPNLFTPKSLVMLNDGSSSGGLSSMLDSSGLGSLAALAGVSSSGSSNSALAEKLAKSNTMIDIIAKEFNLSKVYKTEDSDFPVTELRTIIKEKLTLEPDETTGTMEIGYEDIDRNLATAIVNRTVELLEVEFSKIDSTSNQSQKELLEQKLVDVEAQIKDLENQYISFQKKYGIMDATSLAGEFASKIMGIKTSMITLDSEIEALTSRAGVENPIVLEKLRNKRGLENALKTLENEGGYGLPSMQEMSQIVIENERLNREIEVQATIYQTVLQQYEMIKLTDRGTGPTFQVIEKAEIPEMKSGPSRGKLCVIVTMAAFFLSLFTAFLAEFWQNLKQDPERMKKLKGEV